MSAISVLWLIGISRTMLFKVFPYQLSHYLRGCHILGRAQLLKGILLGGVNQHREARRFLFHILSLIVEGFIKG